MPVWADNNTARLYVKVNSHKKVHTVLARMAANATVATAAEAQERISAAYFAMKSFLPTDFEAKEARFVPFGQNSSQPIALAPEWDDVVGIGIPALVHTAKYMNFVGRGTGRSHTSIKLWGIALIAQASSDDDWTASPAEYNAITNAKAALDGAEPLFVCRNLSQAVFSDQPRTRVSAFWQTALR